MCLYAILKQFCLVLFDIIDSIRPLNLLNFILSASFYIENMFVVKTKTEEVKEREEYRRVMEDSSTM